MFHGGFVIVALPLCSQGERRAAALQDVVPHRSGARPVRLAAPAAAAVVAPPGGVLSPQRAPQGTQRGRGARARLFGQRHRRVPHCDRGRPREHRQVPRQCVAPRQPGGHRKSQVRAAARPTTCVCVW